MHHRLRRTAPWAIAGLITAALSLPGVAGADKGDRGAGTRGAGAGTCDVTLTDPSGLVWDLYGGDGTVTSGGDGAADAYGDGMGYAYVSEAGDEDDYDYYQNPERGGCTFEDGGREVVFPVDEDVNGLGVDISRKVFVPSEGMALARWLDVLSNPGDEPITFNYEWYGAYDGIDAVVETASGDEEIELGERWAAFEQDISVASLWDGPGDVRDRWDTIWRDGDPPGEDEDYVDYLHNDVTIPAGGRVIFMRVEHQNRTPEGAARFARENEGSLAFYAGMSSDEREDLMNWRYVAPSQDEDEEDNDSDDAEDAPPPPVVVEQQQQLPDPLSFTALFGTQRSTTVSRTGLFMVPGMTVNCSVLGPCQVYERGFTAKGAQAASHRSDKRHGLLARDRDVLAAGQSNAVRMRLGKAANRTLRRAGRLRMEAMVTVTDAKGRSQLVRKTITLRTR